jgi:hypothetical protein
VECARCRQEWSTTTKNRKGCPSFAEERWIEALDENR